MTQLQVHLFPLLFTLTFVLSDDFIDLRNGTYSDLTNVTLTDRETASSQCREKGNELPQVRSDQDVGEIYSKNNDSVSIWLGHTYAYARDVWINDNNRTNKYLTHLEYLLKRKTHHEKNGLCSDGLCIYMNLYQKATKSLNVICCSRQIPIRSGPVCQKVQEQEETDADVGVDVEVDVQTSPTMSELLDEKRTKTAFPLSIFIVITLLIVILIIITSLVIKYLKVQYASVEGGTVDIENDDKKASCDSEVTKL